MMLKVFLLIVLLMSGGVADQAPLVIMRHALAPGMGDPADFRLDDCTTQRNLSELGRQQARNAGAMLKKRGIDTAQVLSSAWCRCRDTAELLDLGEVQTFSALNSFFQDREKEEPQMRRLREWIREWDGKTPTVLVTHQVVMTALTGQFPASGEIWFLRKGGDGGADIVERIRVPVAAGE
jgi:broad specificity phosphatase PhoE